MDALVVPGANFGPAAGMLHYAALVAQSRGMTVHRHNWTSDPPDAFAVETEDWVRAQLAPVLDDLGGSPLVIGKSLGSVAVGLVAERSLPAVWLTPLLTLSCVTDALARARAPYLLVGGTNDWTWDPVVARELTPHVVEIAHGDHGLAVSESMTATIAALGEVTSGIDTFLSQAI